MSTPISVSTLLASALAGNAPPDLALAILSAPCLTWDEPPLQPATVHWLFRIASGADETGLAGLAFMRSVAELLLVEEMS